MANPELFQGLRALLEPYAAKGFTVTQDCPNRYELTSIRSITLGGRKYDRMMFASVIENKSSTVMHFFPLYPEPKLGDRLDPAVVKLLQGKTCLHFKKLDDALNKAVSEMLDIGYEWFKSKDWV